MVTHQPKRGFLALTALLLGLGHSTAGASACTTAEQDIWSCEYQDKFYTICASNDLGPHSGYMQYRVYQKATQELAYPASHQHPRGLFKLKFMPKGAAMSFSNGAYAYEIYEPLAGNTEILVSKGRKRLANLSCRESSNTLTLTSIQNFLATVGIYER